jgi:two-component system KDP operon response regulator KdpE
MVRGEVGVEKRILIVGGDRNTRELLTRTLACIGFQVATANDSVGGLAKLGIVRPHLVILDLDGWETLQRIRTLSPIPVIVLIADEQKSRVESLERGADFFVTKPPSIQELCAKVRASFRRA